MITHESGQHTNLTDLVRDPSRVGGLEPTQIPALLVQLNAVQASMAAHLVATTQAGAAERHDALLNVEEAAKRLGVSTDWIYRRTRKLPFVVRVGRNVRFSSNGIDRYVRNRMGAK